MLNRVVLIGRLTHDPELRYTNSGTAVCTFTLAVDRNRTNESGERETDFINIVVWKKQAETTAQYLHQGRLAAIDGRLQIRSYENREGQRVKVAEIVAESVRFLDRGENNAQSQKPAGTSQPTPKPQPQFDDDPFADDGQTIDISDDDLPF